jgi:hypothetical protein
MKRVQVLRPFDGHAVGAIIVLDHDYARAVIRRGLAEHPRTLPVIETKQEAAPEPAPAADPLDHDGNGKKGGAKKAVKKAK